MEKPIKIYCHFLPHTQSQTQAVTECLHSLLQSTGSSPASDDFETNLSKKTRPGVFSADEQKTPGCTAQHRWAQADTWPGTQLRVLLVTAIERIGTGLPQHNTLLPQGTQSFYGWKCFHWLCCSQAKQQHGLQVAGNSSSQHTCKGSKGHHTAGSVTPWDSRLARQAGRINSLVFPPVFRRLSSIFYFKQFKCSWWQTSLQKQVHTVMTSLTHMETHNILITCAGQIKE